MDFLHFALSFLAMLTFGALSITGWFFVTRGRKETMPDNSQQKRGKLFRDFYFFFTQTNGSTKIYFKDDQLKAFLLDAQHDLIKAAVGVHPYLDIHEGKQIYFGNCIEINKEIIRMIGKQYDVHFLYIGRNEYRVAKSYPDYVFPEWIRHPIAVCVTCFASLYGSMFYWLIVPYMQYPFAWSDVPQFHRFLFWVVFCLSLAVLNTALAKKYNSASKGNESLN